MEGPDAPLVIFRLGRRFGGGGGARGCSILTSYLIDADIGSRIVADSLLPRRVAEERWPKQSLSGSRDLCDNGKPRRQDNEALGLTIIDRWVSLLKA